MDARSEACLAHVHPDLARVIRTAAQEPQPFVVILGIRAPAAEAAAVASGHSETLRSRHLPDSHYPGPEDPAGLACAVDVMAMIDGQGSFAPGREEQVFGQIAAQVKAAAAELGIPIQWGGDPVGAWTPGVVSHFRDWDHFQLPWAQYP
jgi:peptidoglycan L-alanyl-D-glutamate endopeptidase CwlK